MYKKVLKRPETVKSALVFLAQKDLCNKYIKIQKQRQIQFSYVSQQNTELEM